MNLRYKFFLVTLVFLQLPYFTQAIRLPNRSILWSVSHPYSYGQDSILIDNQLSPSSSELDQAALLRKNMDREAMVQRAWLSSMVVPGLGQSYNKHYWKVPCIYLGFGLLLSRVYSEHQEMNKHRRTLILDNKTKPTNEFTNKRITECERTRNLFIMITAAWYLLNVFDAYAGSHDKTINFKDDIATKPSLKSTTVVKPTSF